MTRYADRWCVNPRLALVGEGDYRALRVPGGVRAGDERAVVYARLQAARMRLEGLPGSASDEPGVRVVDGRRLYSARWL